jgi:hypothetical protein
VLCHPPRGTTCCIPLVEGSFPRNRTQSPCSQGLPEVIERLQVPLHHPMNPRESGIVVRPLCLASSCSKRAIASLISKGSGVLGL